MEIKVIIWIVLGLIYLFARRKKKQEPPRPARQSQDHDEYESPEGGKPQTFEELLREIEGMKRPEPQPEPTFDLPPTQREREKEITTYDYDAPAGKKQLEDANYDYRDHDKIYEVYEEAKRQAFYKPSLEETVRLTDTIVRFEPKKYKTEPRHNHASEFFNELKDPKSFRKAFLLSEILKRKF